MATARTTATSALIGLALLSTATGAAADPSVGSQRVQTFAALTVPLPHDSRSLVVDADGTLYALHRDASSISVLPADADDWTRTLEAPGHPDQMALAPDGALWTANTQDDSVSRIDPATGAVRVIPVGDYPEGITVGQDGTVYVSAFGGVHVIPPGAGAVARVANAQSSRGIAVAADGTVYVAASTTGSTSSLHVIAPGGSGIARVVDLPAGSTAVDVAPSGDVVVANYVDRSLSVVPPGAAVPSRTIPIGAQPADLAIGPDGRAYTADPLDGTVSVVDLRTGDVDRVPVGASAGAVAVDRAGTVYASDGSPVQPDPELWQLDPHDVTLTRLAGDDRYQTAVATARDAHPRTNQVVISSGADGHLVDALAAGPLAAGLDAPVLLSGPRGLDASTQEYLRTSGARSAVLVGGPSAVAPEVESQLSALGLSHRRIQGQDRYETAALVSGEAPLASSDLALLASGESGHLVDAVVVGGPAAALGAPVLLVRADHVPAPTAAVLQARDPEVVLVGGVSAIWPAVGDQVGATDRLAGADRYLTSVEVVAWALDQGLPADDVVGASGEEGHLVDALSASALGLPTVLGQASGWSDDVLRALLLLAPQEVRLVGGDDTVPDPVG